MKIHINGWLILCCLFIIGSCKTVEPTQVVIPEPEVEIIFLQLNDVYEIEPLEGGRVGGLARVATIRNQLLKENPNTYTVLAGDFLNPSLISTMKLEGKRVAGRHIVEVLNIMGLDLATFGNHEFDLKFNDLQDRIDESTFDWISSNVYNFKGDYFKPFEKQSNESFSPIPQTMLLHFSNAHNDIATIGILSVTLPFNKASYVWYDEVFPAAQLAYDELVDTADIIIALTHLDMDDDNLLAQKIPGISLIMGGHDHENMYFKTGNTYIAKADANAKTVYVHRLKVNLATREITLNSELIPVEDNIADDEATAMIVDKWTAIADQSMIAQGFDKNEVLLVMGNMVYDGRESIIRNQPAELCQLIARAMTFACPESDLAILNSGSVRVDDLLSGELTQYDVLRTLPFGGKIVEVDMKGSLLAKILQTGWENQGTGGYLQWDKVRSDSRRFQWFIKGELLDTNTYYRVASTDFLMTGMETNLDFFIPENPEILEVYYPKEGDNDDLRQDIRKALISYLKFGGK